ncbi:hypothetical protein K438DRAFT_2144948, partial [Mycena galopus ATCC 62051]
ELTKHRQKCEKYGEHLVQQTARRRERAENKTERRVKKRRTNATPASEALNAPPSEPIAGPSSLPLTGEPADITMGDVPSPPRQPSPPLVLTKSGRPARSAGLPKRFQHILPGEPAPVVVDSEPVPQPPVEPLRRRVILHVRDTMETAWNRFRVLRLYLHRPSYDPDSHVRPEDLANFPLEPEQQASLAAEHDTPDSTQPPPPWPFRNMTIYNIMSWLNTGSNQKSEAEATRFVNDVIHAPDFVKEDLLGFNAHTENMRFDKASSADAPWNQDGWKEIDVDIKIPAGKNLPPHKFTVPGLHRRSIVEVIKSAFTDASARDFHLIPFKRLAKSASGVITRIYDEVYTCNAWIEVHNALQKLPAEPGCKLERVIAGLMFWSDSTHLADFGTAKAWPIYMYFANLSKYTRARPNSGACHHIAYIPSIPDRIIETIFGFTKTSHRKPLITHCRRELMQQVWRLMLDEDFKKAYAHGIVIKCIDGITRRVYPRIFTYSADYPEKVLLATIRDKGFCLCPRCLVQKKNVDQMGTARDLRSRITGLRTYFWTKIEDARKAIYESGFAVTSKWVENILQEFSLVPTINAFSEFLRPYGAEVFPILVVDLLHEFELGVWKAIFTHLIRVLYAVSSDAVAEFDKRFRMVPTFGRDTIRRITSNASERKKLAGRDYEDFLQTIIAVIEGLLPEPLNSQVMTMLFRLAEWHALAKLRMHSDDTLARFDKSTSIIGRQVRDFRDYTKSNFATKELPGETAARARRKQNKAKNAPAGVTTAPLPPPPPPPPKGKFLNLDTYKWHAIGDYPSTIPFVGTTDSYSTVIGELAHRLVKLLYRRTNKNNAIKQVTKLERRQKRLQKARQAADAPRHRHAHHVRFSDNEPRMYTGVEVHHHISPSRNNRLHLMSFVHIDENFIPRLKDHLLGRLLQRDFDGDEEEFSEENRATVRIVGQHIYSAKLLRINYTTYDMRCDQDTINPRTHADVMVVSPETGANAHPFWYAHVLGIFHTEVLHTGEKSRYNSSQRMEFLWVRWFGMEPNYRSGFKAARLPKVGFVPEEDPSAFGFLDPSLVLRACHLVPAFAGGRTSMLLKTISPTAARPLGEIDDWANFYVTMWVDRDMFMRYLGGGVGHISHASALPADDLDMDEEPAESESSAPPLQEDPAPHQAPPQADVLGADDPNEQAGGDDGGNDSEDSDDSDVDSDLDLDSDEEEGEGSDGAYDDDVEGEDIDFAQL